LYILFNFYDAILNTFLIQNTFFRNFFYILFILYNYLLNIIEFETRQKTLLKEDEAAEILPKNLVI